MPDVIPDLRAHSPGLTTECGAYLGTYRVELAKRVDAGDCGVAVSKRHAFVLDGLLGALACAARGAATDTRFALVAVGGYGRGSVALHSDVDVILLTEGDPAELQDVASGFLYPLWDSGLEVGHVVRTIDETISLAREDVKTATAVLDARHICGDPSLTQRLHDRARRHLFEPEFARFHTALREATEKRHERFGGSLFTLEPELKSGRGGLRDVDTIGWLSNARSKASSRGDMVRQGLLLRREADALEHAEAFLARVRNYLHLSAHRRQDRLTFPDQEEISERLGFEDGLTLAVERFMQTYYRHARTIAGTLDRLFDRWKVQPRRSRVPSLPLGDGLLLFDQQVTLEDSDALATDPPLALRLYREVVKRGLPPYPFAREAIARAAAEPDFGARLRSDPHSADLLLGLLDHSGRAPVRRGSVIGELHEVGLIVALIPEFAAITGQVQHDAYHTTTLDVHTVASLDCLHALTRGERPEASPIVKRLANEVPRRSPLFAALLLHEIGGGYGRGSAERCARLAGPIANRLGLRPMDATHVTWLLERQHDLYHWATRRDTSDPDLLTELAEQVGSEARLRDLYLLSWCHLATVNPSAMTTWKSRLLDQLYIGLLAVLQHGRPSSGRAEEIRAETKVGFVGDLAQDRLEGFVDSMPTRYLLATPVDEIRTHARMARDRGEASAWVGVGAGVAEALSELVIVTDDRPGLLRDITAAFAACQIEVCGAQIYTRPRAGLAREAFDIFHVRRRGRRLRDEELRRIKTTLAEALDGTKTTDELVASIESAPSFTRRRLPSSKTEVRIDNDCSRHFTVVDVYTSDRVGLLHTIASALSDLDLTIALSKINTEGDRVADVFYVLDADGAKVGGAARVAHIEAELTRVVDALHRSVDQ